MKRRRAVTAANESSWQHLIPTPPTSGLGTALAMAPARTTVDTPVATFLPTNYEMGYSYPLIVWLHEKGGNERHLPQVMQHISTQNFVAVAPQASHECNDQLRSYQWVQQPVAIAAAGQAVSEAIDLARSEFSVHDSRIFLVGHGNGGSMALRLAMQTPERFAGVISINGALPRRHSLLRNVNRLRKLPFLLSSSRDYPQYPETAVCRDLRLLHSAGCNVDIRQYPGSDDLTTCMLADVNRWVMERVCG
ncbi:alpha/beta hydrolase [Aeoliella mucimassa]|uniref:Phospholipase/Carboxylesterase n=1 Tax=Aeoliella mucimassa TaxID=2527972 RepID=A0A518AKS1_9BACT|nr:alpha/beta hydrolase-fold protein [Aeoliella mucimassa]QDU55329.1 Phospholipase/Carboxylesterase [Aeoliella mucimassa]